MSTAVWIETATVRLIEIDAHGTLAVGALCDFLQEAAGTTRERSASRSGTSRSGTSRGCCPGCGCGSTGCPPRGAPRSADVADGRERLFALRDFECSTRRAAGSPRR